MGSIDFIILGIIILVVGRAVFYIIKKKRSGTKCIGCPYAEQCSKNSRECIETK